MVAEIKPGVYSVGSVDWDRRLFDELIPLPQGTSYNAYLVGGSEKTALIDTVDPTKEHELVANLKTLSVSTLDYVVSNHAEQDHSGAIPKVLELYPEAQVVTNPRCRDILKSHLLIPDERFFTIQDGGRIVLGGRTLEFISAPWVHWPETMFTYLKEDRILFTCDFLGSHLASSSLYVTDQAEAYRAAKRYYAEIMMPFRAAVRTCLEKIRALEVEVIATSHGPIYDKPGFILEAYRDWSSDEVKNAVALPFVSMHGSTRRMVDHLVYALTRRGVTVTPFNLSKTDIGELAMALVDAATVVLAAPTVLAGAHPLALYAAYLIKALRPKTRFASLIGSYGWGSQLANQIKDLLAMLKIEILDPVIIEGYPKASDLQALDKLADIILEKHRSIGL